MTENSSRLEIHLNDEVDKYENASQRISSEKIVGHFSVNEKAVYCADARQIQYLHYQISDGDVSVNFNLDHMPDSVIKKNEPQTWKRLNNMFIWVSLNSSHLLATDEVIFVTFRGNISKIMCSPYDNEDWTICAKYSNGIIYLNSFDTKNDIERMKSASTYELKCQTWGFKFEQYMLTDDPKVKPNPNQTLNTNEMFCCVYDRMFSDHRVIYGAEMDGIISDQILDLKKNSDILSDAEFVELKTSKKIEHNRQDRTFRRYKMLKWWSQSYLAGVKTIVCGFRTQNGIVTTLKRYEVSKLPNLAVGLWNKNVCLNFLVRFLDFVKRVVLEDGHKTRSDVWKFDLIPQRKVCASKVTDLSSVYTSDFKEIKITVVN